MAIFRRILLITLLGLSGLNLWIFKEQVQTTFDKNAVTVSEQQLLELQRAMPPNERIGYISEEEAWSSDAWMRRYFIMQYVLSPVIVTPQTSPEWIVGHFEVFDPEAVPDDLELSQDFGNGVMLFRRK